MERDTTDLLGEIRYAERLCSRTARLYRRLHTFSTFMSVLGGSAAVAAVAPSMPAWLSAAGGATLALFGAVSLAVRPAEKAAANEAEAKRYAQLRTAARTMEVADLQAALDKARESDLAELEPLRDVVYNDVANEVGRPDAVVPLSTKQRLLAALA